MTSGTKVAYYKRKIWSNSYEDEKLMDELHYFGVAGISEVVKGMQKTDVDRGDFAEIKNYTEFKEGLTLSLEELRKIMDTNNE